MSKPIKELAPTEQVKAYRKKSKGLFASEFVSALTPFVTVMLVNKDKYFKECNGTKISIGFFLALAIMGLAIWLVSKQKFKGTMVTLIVGWVTVTAIFYLLSEIMTDISTIMLFGLIGILGAYGLDIGSKKMDTLADELEAAISEAKKDMAKESYIAEVKEKEAKKENHQVEKDNGTQI